METQPSSKPPLDSPPPAKEAFGRRSKFLWPLFLTFNLSLGAYLYMRTKKKEAVTEEEVGASVPSTPTIISPTTVVEKPVPSTPIQKPEPIPESQQRELFKWILEEKRKVKPKDREEKKRIDEEKAILKQFIRAKSIPSV